jgi:uncharacterized protein YcfL
MRKSITIVVLLSIVRVGCRSRATLLALQQSQLPEITAKATGKSIFDYNRIWRFGKATHSF